MSDKAPETAWDGVPINSKRDGWHWLGYHGGDRTIFCKLWHDGLWIEAAGHPKAGPSLVCIVYRYLGPCLSPAEVAALIQKHQDDETEEIAARIKAAKLWALLDDIDTLDDVVKDNDAAFRSFARVFKRRRFEVMSGEEYAAIRAELEKESGA